MLSEGFLTGSPDDLRDGFIHLSTREQLKTTLERHFAGEQGLVVLEIDATTLNPGLKWEPSRGGALFPHLYERLSMDAVVRVAAPEDLR